MPFAPFRDMPVTTRFARVLEQVLDDIHALDDAVVRGESPATLKRRFVGRARLVPLVLDVPGCRVVGSTEAAVREVVVPFIGDPLLWKARPTGCFPGGDPVDCPEVVVEAGTIRFSCIADAADTAGDGLGRGVEEALGAIAAAVARIGRDVKRHNAAAFRAVCQALQMKRSRARQALRRQAAGDPHRSLRGAVPAAGLPLEDVRRTRLAALPQAREGRSRGFVLPAGECARIVEIVRGCLAAIGRSPTAVRAVDADVVRTFLLIQLNAHFESANDREAFSVTGEGDIVLESAGRAAFVVRTCFWPEADAGGDVVERALAGLRGGVRRPRLSRRAKGLLVVVHAEAWQHEARHAIHAAAAAHGGCGSRPDHGDVGDARFPLVAVDGVIDLEAIACGLRAE